ncbi:hypothetical protein CTAYLR_005605 [Chrysophaeum taylorii]|uniref:NADH dehydrogenase [ubiquinone] 1 alpha subcomplex subunit 12 n=1 Tax=Chrysophaeum taylorii TaxID=2483200 RepID=A0AAD7U7R7_9STRA|nr:hypothetical protein CTAYLR_005605 [Chrysophaeum taylorii]
MASIYVRWAEAFRRYGWKGVYEQCTMMGTVKFGRLVGEDHLGNKYFEDLNEKHGQHRWVQYKDIWNYDAAMVPPAWHSWLCHITDEPGNESEEYLAKKVSEAIQVDKQDDCIYDHHVGLTNYTQDLLWNDSSKRLRGYNVGAIHQDPAQPEGYYKQPGSVTSDVDGEFKRVKGYEPWDPTNPGKGATKVKSIRDLDLV